MQQFVDAGIDGEEGRLVAMGIVDGHNAEVIALMHGGEAVEAAAVVPFERDAMGDDDVEAAAFEAGEGGPPARQSLHFAFHPFHGETDAATAQVIQGLGPDGVPEVGDAIRVPMRAFVLDDGDGDIEAGGAATSRTHRR